MDTRKVNNSEILNYYILKQIRNPLNLNTNILKILIVLHSLVWQQTFCAFNFSDDRIFIALPKRLTSSASTGIKSTLISES